MGFLLVVHDSKHEAYIGDSSSTLGFFKPTICSFMMSNVVLKLHIVDDLALYFVCSTPLFLAVNLVYGSEVSKELTPLWILGPLVTALYVKMLQGICSLYVFSFMQTVKIVKNLPAYYMLVHEYLFRGKLKEAIHKYIWQPLVDVKNMDYKEVTKTKLKDFQGWLVEKYLDFVESIWPYYCRTIRFLKRANLI